MSGLGGLGVEGRHVFVSVCCGGGGLQRRKQGAAEGGGKSQTREGGEAGETAKLAFQKAIDRLPLKYHIGLASQTPF